MWFSFQMSVGLCISGVHPVTPAVLMFSSWKPFAATRRPSPTLHGTLAAVVEVFLSDGICGCLMRAEYRPIMLINWDYSKRLSPLQPHPPHLKGSFSVKIHSLDRLNYPPSLGKGRTASPNKLDGAWKKKNLLGIFMFLLLLVGREVCF